MIFAPVDNRVRVCRKFLPNDTTRQQPPTLPSPLGP